MDAKDIRRKIENYFSEIFDCFFVVEYKEDCFTIDDTGIYIYTYMEKVPCLSGEKEIQGYRVATTDSDSIGTFVVLDEAIACAGMAYLKDEQKRFFESYN